MATGLTRELRAVWILLAADAAAVFVTYARLPAGALYHVSGSGLRAGLGRAVVELNFPDALVALAVLGVLAPRLGGRERLAAAAAALLCLVVVVPEVVSQTNLDAKWVNAVPAAGVALTFALTLRAGRIEVARTVRLIVVAPLILLAAPWIAALLGFYLDGVPLLDRLFQTGRLVTFHNVPHHAVHHGVHHGLQGLLLLVCALLLVRLPNRVAPFLALMVAYGLGNMANDAWLEQVAERGWTSWTIPSCLEPAVNWTWLAVLAGAAALWWFWLRQPSRTTPAAASSAISSSP